MSRSAASSSPTTGRVDDASQSDPADRTPDPATMRVLVVTGLGHKNDRHYGPLADAAGETTLVCLDPTTDVDGATHVRVPDVGPRIVRLAFLFVLALYEGYRNDYDAVASISLVPYGFYALALRAVYGYPAHLGIIGIDLDHHAQRWYGAVPRWAFRRFDAVSVPGSTHAEELARVGVPSERIERLTNPIDADIYRPSEGADADYDFVWAGRFSAEKDPVLFVEALAMLESRGREFRAVVVGDGPLRDDVVATIDAYGLDDHVDLAGWVDEPVTYYRRSSAFVLTSKRDAMPLVMLEAMATGLVPIVPPVGSIPDVVADGENGIVFRSRDPETVAATMERCLDETDRLHEIATTATSVREAFSLEAASDDWRRILVTLASGDGR